MDIVPLFRLGWPQLATSPRSEGRAVPGRRLVQPEDRKEQDLLPARRVARLKYLADNRMALTQIAQQISKDAACYTTLHVLSYSRELTRHSRPGWFRSYTWPPPPLLTKSGFPLSPAMPWSWSPGGSTFACFPTCKGFQEHCFLSWHLRNVS